MEQPLPFLEACRIGRLAALDGIRLLTGVSFALRAGERLGLAGPTGAGKTLLLRCLALLEPVDEGEIRWQDQPVHGAMVPGYRARVVYLHQRPVLVEGTVEANLRLPFGFASHRGRQYEPECAAAWLEQLGRGEPFLAKRQSDLSGGEAQLAALVRALLVVPQVLLLDEPTSALDPQTATLAEQLIQRWAAERPDERAYVWVSHDTSQTERMCEQIVRMREGQLK